MLRDRGHVRCFFLNSKITLPTKTLVKNLLLLPYNILSWYVVVPVFFIQFKKFSFLSFWPHGILVPQPRIRPSALNTGHRVTATDHWGSDPAPPTLDTESQPQDHWGSDPVPPTLDTESQPLDHQGCPPKIYFYSSPSSIRGCPW